MQIDTAGTYLLKYTAEDDCGNVTEVTREVVAEQISYRTVLYTDGTFIINEKSTDRSANIALHGAVQNEYDPFDPNGDTDIKKYIFTGGNQRPWHSQRASILSVEIGSNILPTDTSYWFYAFSACTNMNLSRLNTSLVTSMASMFDRCQELTSLDVSDFDTSLVTDMTLMFNRCQKLTTLDLHNFSTSLVTSMRQMFSSCSALTSLILDSFDTSAVISMMAMFSGCVALPTLDLSSFNTSSVTNTTNMFTACQTLTTLFASERFVVTQVTASTDMFSSMSTNLVGGAGTAWNSSNPKDKTYAHIDGGTSNPGYFTAAA